MARPPWCLAFDLTAAQASSPATQILESSSLPPLVPPPRPAAPDRLFARSQALRSFAPARDQLGSNRKRRPWPEHHLTPRHPGRLAPWSVNGSLGNILPTSSSLCANKTTEIFFPLLELVFGPNAKSRRQQSARISWPRARFCTAQPILR